VRRSARMRGAPLRLGSRAPKSLFVKAQESPSAFSEVYVAYHAAVLRYFARRTLDPDVAFDLMAETFADLFANITTWNVTAEEQGLALMWTVARRRLYDWYERGRVERRFHERVGVEPPVLGTEDYERIEELADFEGAKLMMQKAMEMLTPNYRQILTLRIVDELPYETIAESLGVTSAAARIRVSKARRKLAEIMDQLDTPDAKYRGVCASEELLT
jgi:RNA polymerase sigma factor (sigma-70 family)